MTLLVASASSRQGMAVCRQARAAGLPVRALVRRADAPEARALAALGVELAVGDFDRPDSLRVACHGAARLFACLPLSLGQAELEVRRGKTLFEVATECDVGHVVYSAALWTDRASGVPHFESKRRLREHLRKSGLPATVLEPAIFMENLLLPRALEGVRAGRLVTPQALGKARPLVAIDDIGTAACWALDHPEQAIGRSLPLYAEVLSPRQQAEAIGDWLGRPIGCRRLHPWLARGVLGRDLARMSRYLDSAEADLSLDAHARPQIEWTGFVHWLRRVDYAN